MQANKLNKQLRNIKAVEAAIEALRTVQYDATKWAALGCDRESYYIKEPRRVYSTKRKALTEFKLRQIEINLKMQFKLARRIPCELVKQGAWWRATCLRCWRLGQGTCCIIYQGTQEFKLIQTNHAFQLWFQWTHFFWFEHVWTIVQTETTHLACHTQLRLPRSKK